MSGLFSLPKFQPQVVEKNPFDTKKERNKVARRKNTGFRSTILTPSAQGAPGQATTQTSKLGGGV